jgi:tight adherence protein C
MSLAIAVGALWGLLVATWLHTTTAPARTPPLPAARRRGPDTPARPPTSAMAGTLLAALGRLVRRLGRAAVQRSGSAARQTVASPSRLTADSPTPGNHTSDRLIGGAVLGGLFSAVALHPLPGAAILLAALVAPHLGERRQAHRRASAVVDQLPDVVDLLRLTALAGLPVGAAIIAIGRRPGGVVGRGLQGAATKLHRGASTADALGVLAATCGTPARSLVDALIDHDRYGTPLVPVLDRMAVEYRLRRRQQAEEAARRLPVTLLFPLVLTTLPACALLTVVPLLVASVASLQT